MVFAIIIILGPATGAAINPARYLGAVVMQGAFGGSVHWVQLPAYLAGEIQPGSRVPGDEERSQRQVSGATS